MEIRVKLYPPLGKTRNEVKLKLPPGSTVDDAVAALIEQRELHGSILPNEYLIVINKTITSVQKELSDGDCITLLPPMAGG